jgi:hypothetical protein
MAVTKSMISARMNSAARSLPSLSTLSSFQRSYGPVYSANHVVDLAFCQVIVYWELDLVFKVGLFSNRAFPVLVAKSAKLGQQVDGEITHDDRDLFFLLQVADKVILGRADDLGVKKASIQVVNVISIDFFFLIGW